MPGLWGGDVQSIRNIARFPPSAQGGDSYRRRPRQARSGLWFLRTRSPRRRRVGSLLVVAGGTYAHEQQVGPCPQPSLPLQQTCTAWMSCSKDNASNVGSARSRRPTATRTTKRPLRSTTRVQSSSRTATSTGASTINSVVSQPSAYIGEVRPSCCENCAYHNIKKLSHWRNAASES